MADYQRYNIFRGWVGGRVWEEGGLEGEKKALLCSPVMLICDVQKPRADDGNDADDARP